jgi:5-deoxy-glucuronate isomerase
MEKTLKKYAARIARNEIDPHVRYDGAASGLLLDPGRDEIPLEVLGFGVYRLDEGVIRRETEGREVVLVPQEGAFEVEVDGKRFSGERTGGPFAAGPGASNASAVYIPAGTRFTLRGSGEMAFFEAPALQTREAFSVGRDQVEVVSRGGWTWRRDVAGLVSPKNGSSNLTVGETYNPPGLWSGTPLHVHDSDNPSAGESDHEEVYYHRFGWPKEGRDRFGPYGVQLLMDGATLNKAFVIGDKSAFAIPGGCHPVVASPASDLLYLWGLAGSGSDLAMRDVPEFAHLKSFEAIFAELGEGRGRTIGKEELGELAAAHGFSARQTGLLVAILRERGFEVG